MQKQTVIQGLMTLLHRVLDLRLLLVVLVGCLLLSSWRPQFWEIPNELVFRTGQWLAPSVRHPPQVALLQVDKPEWALWSAETGGAPGLAQALHALSDQGAVVGLVLQHPLGPFDLSSTALASLLEEDDDHLARRIEQARQTRQLLASQQVVLGIAGGRTPDQKPLPVQQGRLKDTLPLLRRWLWPLPDLEGSVAFPEAGLDYFPVLTRRGREQPLLFEQRDEVFAGFALQVLSRYLSPESGKTPGTAVVWHRDRGVQMGNSGWVPLSAAGALVPRVVGYSTMDPSFARMSLAAAVARPVSNGIVLIGSAGNPALERLAATLVALVDDIHLTQPWWFAPFNKSLILLLAALLAVLLPRLTGAVAALVVLAGAVGLLGAQLLAQLFWGWWLPAADLFWLLLFGGAVMGLWQITYARHLEMQRRLHLISMAHAQRLTDMGELHQAQQTLTGSRLTGSRLTGLKPEHQSAQPYVALAEAFASRGDYTQALQTLAALDPPRAQQEQLKAKTEQWKERASAQASTTNLATTLVMELEGPMVLGRYEIQRELGRGATGIVYLGYDPKIARKVAIKTLNFKHFQEPQLTDIKQRFVREAAAAGRLDHPHIVSVYDVGEERDLAYIAMDFVDGQPLSHFVTEENLLQPFVVYRAMAQVARALHYAHQNNIIHRDVKPANIIYAAEPYQLKVTDFGIARLVDDSRTSTGEILGSPLYISPEQLQGKNVTPCADIFSLGVTFYQLLTGSLPFAGDTLASLTYDIIYGKPASVRKMRPDLPYSATRIVNRAMHKDTSRRYQTAVEMAEAIEKAIRRDFPKEAKAAGLQS